MMATPTYTKAELLAWLKAAPRMDRWDAIVALKREPTNNLLLQQYIENFNQGSYWTGIGGVVPTGGKDFTEAINNFTLDVPRLFYEDTGLDGSKANLEMTIIDGTQLSLLRKIDHWAVNRVYEYSPTEGPKLFLDLLLADVAGTIDGDRRIRLDLRHSSNFRLTFAKTPLEQEKGGEYFRELFEALDDEQRVWVMGEISEGINPMMRPQSFGLRTQRGGAEGEGAILVFVRMQGRHEGGFPGENSGFRYLIPRDAGKDYSATVLVSRGRVLMGGLLKSLGDLIGNHDFDFVFDNENDWVSATAKGGVLHISGGEPERQRVVHNVLGLDLWADIEYSFVGFDLPAAHALTVEMKGDAVVLEWASQGIIPTDIVVIQSNILGAGARLDNEIRYSVSLKAVYELVDDAAGGKISLKEFIYDADTEADVPEQTPALAFPGKAPGDEFAEAVFKLFILALISPILVLMARAALNSNQVKGMIEEALAKEFPSETPVKEFIEGNIKLNFGNAIIGNEVNSPSDVSFFGRINPDLSSFAITTPEPLLAAGASHPFKTQPVINGLRWAVEDLRRGTRSPGRIDPSSGVYEAPQAGQIDDRFTRVRVTASNPVTNFSSSALVTVVANPLTINPLITYCGTGEEVKLTIGTLGEGPVDVSVNNPGPGSGDIEAVDGTYTYIAGPKVEGDTYVLDEIVATYKGQSRSVYMLVKQFEPAITLSTVAGATELPPGQVQLKAESNNSDLTHLVDEWAILFDGPGHMDADIPGRYHADPNTEARFVCIVARWDSIVIGIYKGHIILPLPLMAFSKEVELLSQVL